MAADDEGSGQKAPHSDILQALGNLIAGPRNQPLLWERRGLVGSRTGAVPLGRGLSVAPRFLWECLTSHIVGPFPAPATSHAASGFPALRAPAHFASRVMKPFGRSDFR